MGVSVNGVPLGGGSVTPTVAFVDSVVGSQVTGGFDSITSDSAGAGVILTITVTGDGIHAMRIRSFCRSLDASALGWSYYTLKQDAVQIQQVANYVQVAGGGQHCDLYHVVLPFTGSKTFTIDIASVGTPTARADATYPASLEATWIDV